MQALTSADSKSDGVLRKEEFINSFEQVSKLIIDKKDLEEVFQIYGEKFSKEEPYKIILMSVIQKNFFTPNENLGMTRFFHILGKIKGFLLDKRLKLDYPF